MKITTYVANKMHDAMISKASLSNKQSFIAGILGGIFISMGASFYYMVLTNGAVSSGSFPYGILKAIAGLAFSLGLVAITLVGADLFTSSLMISLPCFKKSFPWSKYFTRIILIYFSNFVGAMIFVALLVGSNSGSIGHGGFAQVAVNVAIGKIYNPSLVIFFRGILANLFVCTAVYISYGAGDDKSAKITLIIFPVAAFVAMAFDHSIANMFFLPFGYIMQNQFQLNMDTLITFPLMLNNLLWASLGNAFAGIALAFLVNNLGEK